MRLTAQFSGRGLTRSTPGGVQRAIGGGFADHVPRRSCWVPLYGNAPISTFYVTTLATYTATVSDVSSRRENSRRQRLLAFQGWKYATGDPRFCNTP